MKRFLVRAPRLVRPCSGARFNGTLVVADHDNNTLNVATRSAVTAAGQLGGDVTVLVAGQNCGAVVDEASKVAGVTTVASCEDARYDRGLAENMANLIQKVTKEKGYKNIVMANNNFAKNILPRAAGLMDVSQVSDVMEIRSPDTFVRAMYAGNALSLVKSEEDLKLLTVRMTSFAPAEDGGAAKTETVEPADEFGKTSFVSEDSAAKSGPSLTSASRIVSGGRGVGSEENFKIIYGLADKFEDCAVGASRAAVDAGFVGNELQVGQTGKVVAPDLYVAVGISGAIQHLAGMKDSKVIVAINKDAEAPIFQVADYGLEADLFKAVPELTEKLSA